MDDLHDNISMRTFDYIRVKKFQLNEDLFTDIDESLVIPCTANIEQ
jgi:hypothetical protein